MAKRTDEKTLETTATPALALAVRRLAPETLYQLIRHTGLDACSEIIAAATPAQIGAILDLDLWRSDQAGHDVRFDAARFAEWVEQLVETDTTTAARSVASLDRALVTAGLSRFIRVFDPGAVATSFDDDLPDHQEDPDQGPECEIGGYLVRAFSETSWDAIVTLLTVLEDEQQEAFHSLMQRCRRLSNSTPEIDGCDDLLMEPEQLLHDLAAARGERRSQQGYSTAADARAFLQLARQQPNPSAGEPGTNPLARAYFEAASDGRAWRDDQSTTSPALDAAPDVDDAGGLPAELASLLAEAGLTTSPRALLAGVSDEPSRHSLVRSRLEYVCERDVALFEKRSEELAFLANTLAAGCSLQSRAFTPGEASEGTISICNLGLEHWPAPSPEAFLMNHDLVSVFETGWRVLYEQVSLFVADRLLATLAKLRCRDASIQLDLQALRRELTRQRQAGTPWLAGEDLAVIAMLDVTVWATLVGLLNECPVIPAAMIALLEGRKGAISPTAFEFVSTRRQLDLVREFMSRVPDILSS